MIKNFINDIFLRNRDLKNKNQAKYWSLCQFLYLESLSD